MKDYSKIIVIAMFLILFLSGCTTKPQGATISNREYNDIQYYQAAYTSCESRYSNLLDDYQRKDAETQQCEKISNEKTILIEEVIKWDDSVYKNTWLMSYPQTAKATKEGRKGILITLVIDVLIGFILILSDKLVPHYNKKFLLGLALMLTIGILGYTLYRLSLYGVPIFLN